MRKTLYFSFLRLIIVLVISFVHTTITFAQRAEWTAAQLPQALFADKAAAEAAGYNTLWGSGDWLGMPAQDLIKTDWVTVSLATPFSYVSKGNGKYSGKAYAYKLIMGMNHPTRDGIDPLFFLEGVTNNDYVRKTGDSDQGNVVNDAIIKIVTEKTPDGVDPWTYSVTMRINRANNAAAFYVVDATMSKMVVQTMTRNHESFVGDNVIRFNIEQGHEYYCMASEKGSVELYSITVCDPKDDDFEVVASEENTTALWTADMLPTTKFASVDEAVAAGFNTLWGLPDYLGMPAQDLIKNDEVTVSLANPYNTVYAVNKIGGGKKHTYKIIMGMNNSTRDGIDPLFFLEGVQNNDYVRKAGDSDQGNVVNDAILKIEVAPNAEGTDPYCSRMIFNYSRGNNKGAFYVVDATKSIPVYQDVTRMDNKIEKKQSAIINVYPGRTYYVMASDKSSVELYNVGFCSGASEKYSCWETNTNDTPNDTPTITTGNNFVIKDTIIRSGKSVLYPIEMHNSNDITAFQCDIYLPEEIVLQTRNGMYDITLDDNRKDDHLILSSLQSDGAIRVVCGSLTLTPFYENNGNLFYLNLLASEDVSGDFDILVKNIYISEPNGTRYDLDDISAKITIPAYTQGDVNDDGLIAIDDVVMSINYILGNNSTNFVFKAGDINSDNRILIDDVVLLVNKILGINTNKALASRQYPDYETVTFSGTDKIYMNLSNVDDYSAMQFDLILPKNTNINDICLNSSSNHTIAYRYVGNELVRVVVTSLTNDSFSENSQFCINVNTTSNSNILLTNAYASSPRGKLVKISDSTALIAGTTDIEGITSTSNPVDIYDMSGRLVKKNAISTDGLHKGVYFMNGKKIIIE